MRGMWRTEPNPCWPASSYDIYLVVELGREVLVSQEERCNRNSSKNKNSTISVQDTDKLKFGEARSSATEQREAPQTPSSYRFEFGP